MRFPCYTSIFDNISIFIENEGIVPGDISSGKTVEIIVGKRPTYQDLFNYANNKFEQGSICVIANTDIIFDETIKLVNHDNIEGKFLCLTSWDISHNYELRYRGEIGDKTAYFSQDSWVFKTPISINNADFYMREISCDTKLAHLATEASLDVRNPSKQIITKQLHLVDYHEYIMGAKDKLSDPSVGVEPTDDINKESRKERVGIIEISGMRRGGNHVIIEWISKHYNEVSHFNNVLMEFSEIFNYKNGQLVNELINSNKILSYEDVLKDSDIYIMRDWYNMSASRLVSNRGWYDTEYNSELTCPEIYLQFCKQWEKTPEKFILYNKLITDNKYKEEIENRFGWDHIDLPTEFPKIGNGSSFGDLNNLNERYLKIVDRKEWQDIKGYKEINEYMKIIFDIEI